MTIRIQTQQEVEITPPPYFKNGFSYYKVLSNGRAIQLWGHAIFVSILSGSDVSEITPIEKAEFDAAYEHATQNIREAFLS